MYVYFLQGGALRCVQRNTVQCVEQTEKPTVTSVPWNHWPVKKTKLSLYLTVVNVAVSTEGEIEKELTSGKYCFYMISVMHCKRYFGLILVLPP